jgi:hypothetical protein
MDCLAPPASTSLMAALRENTRRHSSSSCTGTWISRATSSIASPRTTRSTTSVFRCALHRSGNSSPRGVAQIGAVDDDLQRHLLHLAREVSAAVLLETLRRPSIDPVIACQQLCGCATPPRRPRSASAPPASARSSATSAASRIATATGRWAPSAPARRTTNGSRATPSARPSVRQA